MPARKSNVPTNPRGGMDMISRMEEMEGIWHHNMDEGINGTLMAGMDHNTIQHQPD